MAHVLPHAEITAVDLSADALEVATQNVADYQLAERITLCRSNVYQALPPQQRFDLILSNPPYVTQASMDTLPEEYRHEPEMALAGGEDGMDIVRDIIQGAAARLNPHGLLVVEVGHNRAEVEAAFPELDFTWLSTPSGEEKVFLLHRDQLTRLS
jgi:ribosomal protein L3 glutamine methyltransferase